MMRAGCDIQATLDLSRLIEGEDGEHKYPPINQTLDVLLARMWKYKYSVGLIH